MVGNGPEVTEALEEEVQRLHEVTHYKRQIVKTNIRCPITDKIMEDPVFAADGWSYERDAMASWLKSETVSPVTQGPLAHNRLTPNHQLKAQIIAWAEYEEMERTGEMGGEDDRQEELIMAVSGRVASLEAGGKEPEAFLDVMEAIEQVPAPASTVPQSPHGIVIPEFLGAELDAEAGAGQRAAGGRSPPGLVAARVASFQVDVDAGAKTGHV
ncbi:hypothetical protein T484DRAFT_1915069 [Baffinella frigidus]|nr:hypothetical protein T484DRAFT_1915069 [Cryptophyta sp. CCMP2293]